LSEWARIEEAARKLVEELAEDFAVPAPRVRVVGASEVLRRCGALAGGCYDHRSGEIVLSWEAAVDVESVLHEFAHHLQYEMAGRNPEKAFSGFDRPHCERPHEAAAKHFAGSFASFYKSRYLKMLGGAERPKADGRRVCGYGAAHLMKAVDERAAPLLELAEEERGWGLSGKAAAEELARLVPALGFEAGAAARACGADPADGLDVERQLAWVATKAAEGDLEGARGALERAREKILDMLRRWE
jgi:hypothetical protein